MVEFALTLPMLLLVVTGIMAFGIAFNNYITLTEATSVGARQLTVSRGQTLDPCNTVSSAVYAAAPVLKQANLTFSITLNGTGYSGTSCSGTSTSGAPAEMILGTNAVVTVTYPINLNLYGIQVVPAGSVMTATTTEVMQ
jgi:Flp pilus assembly protein TadG